MGCCLPWNSVSLSASTTSSSDFTWRLQLERIRFSWTSLSFEQNSSMLFFKISLKLNSINFWIMEAVSDHPRKESASENLEKQLVILRPDLTNFLQSFSTLETPRSLATCWSLLTLLSVNSSLNQRWNQDFTFKKLFILPYSHSEWKPSCKHIHNTRECTRALGVECGWCTEGTSNVSWMSSYRELNEKKSPLTKTNFIEMCYLNSTLNF